MEEIQKQELTSMGIKEAQLQKLKELFPEAFTEGLKVDWDKLRLTLGDETVDTGKERYGMNWPGKADCFKTIQQPSIGTLVPAREESIDFDTTQNLFIEGDNLEVLKLLQKSYLGKIKMICIDPPYNTGNDFIYPDNYSENLDTYLEYTGQIDGEGRKFATNTETDGRFHSKWMNMMYPRLFLAKNLLREDGLIFISIDDSEVDNLKKLCNEIFGEENFIGCIVRTTGQTTGQDSEGLGSSFDYLLVYSKYPDRGLNGLPLTEHDLKRFENEDEKGKYAYDQMRKTGSNDKREDRPNMYYAIKDPDNNDIYPIGQAAMKVAGGLKEKHTINFQAKATFYGKKQNEIMPKCGGRM
jgi:adenine-specific DNA-methyltransferase